MAGQFLTCFISTQLFLTHSLQYELPITQKIVEDFVNQYAVKDLPAMINSEITPEQFVETYLYQDSEIYFDIIQVTFEQFKETLYAIQETVIPGSCKVNDVRTMFNDTSITLNYFVKARSFDGKFGNHRTNFVVFFDENTGKLIKWILTPVNNPSLEGFWVGKAFGRCNAAAHADNENVINKYQQFFTDFIDINITLYVFAAVILLLVVWNICLVKALLNRNNNKKKEYRIVDNESSEASDSAF